MEWKTANQQLEKATPCLITTQLGSNYHPRRRWVGESLSLFLLILGIDWQEAAGRFIFPAPGIIGAELRIKIDREEVGHHMDFVMRAWPLLEEHRDPGRQRRVARMWNVGRRIHRQAMHVPGSNLIRKFSQMKIITGNVHGSGSSTFRDHFLDLYDIHNPDVVIVVESMIGGQAACNRYVSLPLRAFNTVDHGGR